MNNTTSETELRLHKSRYLRIIFITLGICSLSLGVVGIFLPLLPTTVFLLIASYFFARSSERFNNWLLNSRVLGSYIKNYKEGKGMTPGSKVFSVSFLWFGILMSVFFLVQSVYLKIFLLLIAIAVTIHILYLKTFRAEAAE